MKPNVIHNKAGFWIYYEKENGKIDETKKEFYPNEVEK